MNRNTKPELLAPAGSLSKLKVAIDYGADAVYLGGNRLNLRAFADNFSDAEMQEGIEYAHSRGRKVYMTLNVFPHNEDLEGLEDYLRSVRDLGIDALIVSDPGIIMTCREVIPEMELHLSTQANNVNYRSAMFWHQNGVKRIVLARELTLEEIRDLIARTPDTLEIEAFVHGSMCMAYSGRCLLSSYMVGRDANRGECAQPCRYKYYLVEEKRLDQPMEILEDERGTYIMNSKDLCMIQHIPELMESGIVSFKIEGRMKSEYYVAAIVKAYRAAMDAYLADPANYRYDPKWMELLEKVSHRKYHTGFYFGRGNSQIYESSTYVRDYDIVAAVVRREADGRYFMHEKNRIFPNTEVEVLRAKGDVFRTTLTNFRDVEGSPIEVANKAAMYFSCDCPDQLEAGDLIIQTTGEVKYVF
ncbi:U32 family peptidase [Proteiniclasticum sp. QWL-01]|uniref:peptidase U32 family protein n=1 Tax=Proteiniclasticum sp. QWL-01 TaxID=3036945 RepID=UPI0021FEF3CF|nr:U32 family peptidase [Proteiniclasticum sp. QWL-01]UUM12952.1 U32 family peptidase [Clostridiaceae bacterium HFYG-1003]WFF74497.1 U32 family peptidase [Proteiniclasticum sp. QWL-01]